MATPEELMIANMMLDVPKLYPKLDPPHGPRTAFFAGDEALKRYNSAGYTRSDAEKALDYTSLEDNTTRRYITDEGMAIMDSNATALGKMIDHPRMYAAYPSLKDVPVSYDKEPKGTLASYDPDTHSLNYDKGKFMDSNMFIGEEDFFLKELGLLGHEVNHAINTIEGWNPGYGHLAELQNNPELYWNGGNEAQSRLVENLISGETTLKKVGDKGGSIPWMREDMMNHTDSPLFYEEKDTPDRREFIRMQEQAEDNWLKFNEEILRLGGGNISEMEYEED